MLPSLILMAQPPFGDSNPIFLFLNILGDSFVLNNLPAVPAQPVKQVPQSLQQATTEEKVWWQLEEVKPNFLVF